MAGELRCPQEECGAWGIPLENVEQLATLTPEDLDPAKQECCLWHELEMKCLRDPRYRDEPEAEDCFNSVDDSGIVEDEEGPVEGQLKLPL